MGQRLVVGLGNPGPEYDSTWHNLGFQSVRALAASLRTSVKSHRDALIGRGRYAGNDVFLMLPQSYMNLSGRPVERFVREHRIDVDEILVILDDHDLPRGQLRLRSEGGDGGHRGLRSILHELGSQRVARLRIGIRDEAIDPEVGGYDDLADRVLEPLSAAEKEHFDAMAEGAAQAALAWISVGVVAAMNRHNRQKILPPANR